MAAAHSNMRKGFRVSLRLEKLLFVMMLLVPMLILQTFVYYSWFQTRQDNALRTNLEVATAMAATFQFYIDDIRKDELSIGTALASVNPADGQSLDNFLVNATKDYSTPKFWLWVDEHGKVLAATDAVAKSADVTGQPWFKLLAAGQKSLVSDVILNQGIFDKCLVVARRLEATAGQPTRFVIAAIETSRLAELVANVRLTPGATLGIFDRTGHVVHIDPENPAVGTDWASLDPLLRKTIDTHEVQRGEIRWPMDGSRRIVVRLPTPSGFIIGASMDKTQAYAPLVAMLKTTIFWNVAIIVATLLGVMLLSRWMIAQVNTLRQHAQAIGSGNLDHRAEVRGITEFQELASAFNETAQQRKQYETRLQEAHDALEVRSQSLRESNRELEQFAYVASHDLQEPLRMVTGYVQLLARRYKGKLDKDADEFIAYAIDGVDRMQRLIQDLLAYSRLGTRAKDVEAINMEDVLKRATANLSKSIQDSGAEITHDPLPQVTGDETQLVQLLQNLISNAIKFRSDRPPQIHLWAETNNGTLLFNIRDNGIGLDPQYGERIFVIFQRLHTREQYEGTGIGLAICKKIVERHGGRIWVESVPGNGSTFHFTLGESQ